jgi:large subunit ribosomal protein L31
LKNKVKFATSKWLIINCLENRVKLYQFFAYKHNIKVLKYKTMKKGIHPDNYRMVAFKDMSNEDVFLTRSTVDTKETLDVDGVEYPLVKLEISRTSHPFYTGKSKLIDAAGRIDKFKNKYAKFKKD